VVLWRLSKHADLSGEGGRVAEGRWHVLGTPVVYCAEHPALSLLEFLVGVDRRLVPDEYRMLRIEVPDSTSLLRLDHLPATDEHCRQAGQRWLEQRDSALLQVPSVVAFAAWNVLINPAHPEAPQVRITEHVTCVLDARLARKLRRPPSLSA
jgi:RES domain-containing protein